MRSISRLPLVALLLALTHTACGPGGESEQDELDWPEELCPQGLEVEGVAGRLIMGRTTAGADEAKVSLFMEDQSMTRRETTAVESTARDKDSVFRFRDIPDGRHRLQACFKGYSGEAEVEVVDGKSTFVCLWLLPHSC